MECAVECATKLRQQRKERFASGRFGPPQLFQRPVVQRRYAARHPTAHAFLHHGHIAHQEHRGHDQWVLQVEHVGEAGAHGGEGSSKNLARMSRVTIYLPDEAGRRTDTGTKYPTEEQRSMADRETCARRGGPSYGGPKTPGQGFSRCPYFIL